MKPIGVMPAALAAAIPGTESSTTMQSAGATSTAAAMPANYAQERIGDLPGCDRPVRPRRESGEPS
jgi:hypothetical protein